VDPELEAGAGLGVVTIEDAGGPRCRSGRSRKLRLRGGRRRRLPEGRRWARRGGAPAALGDGDAGGADAEDGYVELAGREGLGSAVQLVELDGSGDQADEAAAVDELSGGDVDEVSGWRGGGDLEAPEEGAVAVVSQTGEDARAGAGGHRVGVLGGDHGQAELPGEAGGGTSSPHLLS
jgi:hypothetical protein